MGTSMNKENVMMVTLISGSQFLLVEKVTTFVIHN